MAIIGGIGVVTNITFSTTEADDVLLLTIFINSESNSPAPPAVDGVSSTSGLSWARRGAGSGPTTGAYLGGHSYARMETWWAVAADALTDELISVTTTSGGSASGFISVSVIAVPGLNTSNPWDGNVSLPAVNVNLPMPPIPPQSLLPTATLSTDSQNAMIVFWVGQFIVSTIATGSCAQLPDLSLGWRGALPNSQQEQVFIGLTNWTGGAWKTISSAVSGETFTTYDVGQEISNWIVIADALRCAGN